MALGERPHRYPPRRNRHRAPYTGGRNPPANDPALLVHRYAGWAMTVSFVFWLAYVLKAVI